MFTNAHTTGWEAAVTQELRGELTVVDQVDDLRDEVADTLDILLQRQHDRVKLSAAHRTLATLIPRRDLLVRCGLLPEKNLLIFTSTQAGRRQRESSKTKSHVNNSTLTRPEKCFTVTST